MGESVPKTDINEHTRNIDKPFQQFNNNLASSQRGAKIDISQARVKSWRDKDSVFHFIIPHHKSL